MVRILDKQAIEALLPMDLCIDVVREGMRQLGLGRTEQPLRSVVTVPGEPRFLGVMPGYVPDHDYGLGAKVIAVFPGNFELGLPSHQGVVLLFRADTGELAALVNAEAVTAVRTAAASAIATAIAARPDARRLALIGYGEQALQHARAMPLVRPIEEIVVAGRDPERARGCAERIASEFPGGITVEPSIETAVRKAEIICTLTHAREPIVFGDWLREGTHVNAVGASTRGFREIDAAVVARSRFFGDYAPGIRAQAEEFITPLEQGLVPPGHLLGDLGDVLAGSLCVRRNDTEITCFKSIGNVVQDLCAASAALARAEDHGIGHVVTI